ncbi:hypothetical protein VNI00_004003 [Paramarasmius palmivorus]|uniref:Uncharacterized protein n=1 Tax=Paramarasmius palmivorus TaxID=297713 RepID=A0AAW0DQQ1_9AGAR
MGDALTCMTRLLQLKPRPPPAKLRKMQNFGQQSPSSASNSGFLQSLGTSPMTSLLPGMQSGQSIASDPNSVDTFKQNIQMVLENVIRTQTIARSALTGITNAYHPGSSSAQTQSDIATLQQNLHLLSDMMRHTGVGALPLIPVTGATNDPSNDVSMVTETTVPTEDQMLAQASHAIQVLYDRLKKLQDTAGVVANLLGAPVSGQVVGSLSQGQGFMTPQQFGGVPMGLGGSSASSQGSLMGNRGASQA